MTIYHAKEVVDYGKKPGKIASPMIYFTKKTNPEEFVCVENEEWKATYKWFSTSYGFGEDVYLLDTVMIK